MRRHWPWSQSAAPPTSPQHHHACLTWGACLPPLPAGEPVEPPLPSQLHLMYVAAAAFVLLFFVGCGVLLSRKRRRQHGQLWFPEGFKVSEASKKKRREPLGEDSVGLK